MENCNSDVKSIYIYGVIFCRAVLTVFSLYNIACHCINAVVIAFTTLTFKGGCLWVAVAEASREMHQDPLSLLGLSHQWKSL